MVYRIILVIRIFIVCIRNNYERVRLAPEINLFGTCWRHFCSFRMMIDSSHRFWRLMLYTLQCFPGDLRCLALTFARFLHASCSDILPSPPSYTSLPLICMLAYLSSLLHCERNTTSFSFFMWSAQQWKTEEMLTPRVQFVRTLSCVESRLPSKNVAIFAPKLGRFSRKHSICLATICQDWGYNCSRRNAPGLVSCASSSFRLQSSLTSDPCSPITIPENASWRCQPPTLLLCRQPNLSLAEIASPPAEKVDTCAHH